MSGEDHILCGFSEAGIGVGIGTQQAAGFRLENGAAVIFLANDLVAARQVDDQSCTSFCHCNRRRIAYPDIFTDFHAERKVRHFCTAEQQLCPKGKGVSGMVVQGLLLWNSFCVRSGGEVPDFVEFTVVGQILLGHHAKYLSGIADCGTVVQGTAADIGQPYHQQHGQVSGFL